MTEPESTSPAWYCVRTQPKHEHIAAAGLMKNLELEVFHPRLRLERSTRRGVVRVVEPLFPGYLFVHCSLDERLSEIRYVNGVSSLVHFGNRISTIPDGVIQELKQCFEADEPMAVLDHLHVGAEVIVGEGPFRGFTGTVVRLLPARQRVQLLLDFLGQTTLAEVDRTSVMVENLSVVHLVPSLATNAQVLIAETRYARTAMAR